MTARQMLACCTLQKERQQLVLVLNAWSVSTCWEVLYPKIWLHDAEISIQTFGESYYLQGGFRIGEINEVD